jgi:hypothetical protein
VELRAFEILQERAIRYNGSRRKPDELERGVKSFAKMRPP